MKKYAVVLVAVVLFIFASLVSVFSNDIVWNDIGRGNLNLRTALVNLDRPQVIYAGSSNAVLKTEDSGETWRNILSVSGQNRGVNFLAFDPEDKNSLYAATGNGLFYSSNQGKNWQRIFKGKNSLENECTTLAVLPYGIYLGTKGGLFLSKDKGRSWHKETGKIGKSHILAIAYNLKEPDYIYIACVDGVFKTEDAGKSWERIFVRHPVENGNDELETTEDRNEEERFSDIRYVGIDQNNLNYVYLATAKGVYRSQDRGKTWDLLPDYGLLNRDTQFLLVSDKSQIYAVTKSGIFKYGNERWQELSFGLVTDDIKSLALDNQGNLYAACDKGLFKARMNNLGTNMQDDTITMYYKDEPKINEIHAAAIKYAQVIDPQRIESSRRQARLKAILPEFTLDYDKTITSYSNTSSTRFTIGPLEWGVSLQWNLSDLIWSEQQRLIDSQTRLMVQLRDDILDEATKLYFERLRVKIELDNLSIEDRKKRLEKELRLEELTASLDALTGDYFSQQIKNNKI